jgi:nucleotide-binding universal stress UspA family protein
MYRQVVDAFAKDLDAAKVEHQTIADGASERLRAAGRSADASVRVGDAAAEILGEGATWDADVIVLGSRGRTGLSRILLGSVARNVLLSSDKSVFIVREREGGAA